MLYDIHFQAEPIPLLRGGKEPSSADVNHNLELALRDFGLEPTVSQVNRSDQTDANPQNIYINGRPVSVKVLSAIWRKLNVAIGDEIPEDAEVEMTRFVSLPPFENPFADCEMTGDSDGIHVRRWIGQPTNDYIDLTESYNRWIATLPQQRRITISWTEPTDE
jgi:hypothetical protein